MRRFARTGTATPKRTLLDQFRLDVRRKRRHLSKGQRTQVALIAAVCPEPELLVLDEPTSGLDPMIRREFIETVIGAYQDGDPGRRTVFVSTHLISEFEGLIDEFTIIDGGRELLTLEADTARERYHRVFATFADHREPVLTVCESRNNVDDRSKSWRKAISTRCSAVSGR